ncbi:hypothetical protein JHK87_042492 [Glycine soja]|nr:hypothetical protein JHK87_042492 [Glycine soja]
MIKGKDIYEVVAALVPLYVALILGYGSVHWWKIFTPEQCNDINRFVGAKLFISNQFPKTADAISTLRVDSNVGSLNGREPLQTDAEIAEDGQLHVIVRNMSRSTSMVSPRASNLTGVEIFSVTSSREVPSQRASSFSVTN